jgi:hypothetical protein
MAMSIMVYKLKASDSFLMRQHLGQVIQTDIPPAQHDSYVPPLFSALDLDDAAQILVEQQGRQPDDGTGLDDELRPLEHEPQGARNVPLRDGEGSPDETPIVDDGPGMAADGGAEAVGDGES